MKKCPKCGTVNDDDEPYCVNASCQNMLMYVASEPVGATSGETPASPPAPPPPLADSAPPPPASLEPAATLSPVPPEPEVAVQPVPVEDEPTPAIVVAPPPPTDITCPKCRAVSSADKKICWRCFSPLGAGAPSEQGGPPAGAAETPPSFWRRRRLLIVIAGVVVVALALGVFVARFMLCGEAGCQSDLEELSIDTENAGGVIPQVSIVPEGTDPLPAFDGNLSTAWVAGFPSSGLYGVYCFRMTWDAPVDIRRVFVLPGIGGEGDDVTSEWKQYGRPRKLVFVDGDNPDSQATIEIANDPSNEPYDLSLDDVSLLNVCVTSVWDDGSPANVAIANLEFQGHR